MWFYTAYGLTIKSTFPLPELAPIPCASSGTAISNIDCINIRFDDTVEYRTPLEPGALMFSQVTNDLATFHWPDVGTFCVRDGNDIAIAPAKNADLSTVGLFLLGPTLSALLHQRGWMALHGSAVNVDGHACVFLGGSGWGKSTMCAAMHSRGHSVVSDDVSAIRLDETSHPTVIPAIPRLKVWPDSAQAIGANLDTLAFVRDGYEKRSFATQRFSQHPIGLKCIYVLAKGDELQITPLSPSTALLEFVKHAYGAIALRSVKTAHHFRQYATLVNTVPVKRLTRPWSLDRLPDVIDAVESDLLREQAYSNAPNPVTA